MITLGVTAQDFTRTSSLDLGADYSSSSWSRLAPMAAVSTEGWTSATLIHV